MEKKISLLGLLVNIFLGVSKTFVGIISNSSAILAEGIHSVMDVISSAINYVGVSVSKKPADEKHPYGYYRAEVISGFLITIILFITALWILYESAVSIMEPSLVEVNYISVGVMIFSAAANWIMSSLKMKYGKKYDNISLVSDGIHSRVDVLSSVAVIVGLLAFRYLGFVYADSLIAIAIGIYIMKESFVLGKKAAGSLLDISAGKEIEDKIRDIISEEKIKAESIKTTKRGPKVFSDIEISLPTDLTVDKASMITKGLEKKLVEKIDSLEYVSIGITSHDVTEKYHRGILGQGVGWQRKGRMGGESMGPGGFCVCPKCGYEEEHKRGVPCSSMKCPGCGEKLSRKE